MIPAIVPLPEGPPLMAIEKSVSLDDFDRYPGLRELVNAGLKPGRTLALDQWGIRIIWTEPNGHVGSNCDVNIVYEMRQRGIRAPQHVRNDVYRFLSG